MIPIQFLSQDNINWVNNVGGQQEHNPDNASDNFCKIVDLSLVDKRIQFILFMRYNQYFYEVYVVVMYMLA